MKIRIYDRLPEDAVKIRTAVFMEEQGFQDEFDDIDPIAKHIVLYIDDIAAATGRVYAGKEAGTYVIGRIATDKDYRRKQLGSKVIEALEEQVKRMGGKKIELSAQYRIKEFYEKLGFQCVGEIYLDEHCEHIKMEKMVNE